MLLGSDIRCLFWELEFSEAYFGNYFLKFYSTFLILRDKWAKLKEQLYSSTMEYVNQKASLFFLNIMTFFSKKIEVAVTLIDHIFRNRVESSSSSIQCIPLIEKYGQGMGNRNRVEMST